MSDARKVHDDAVDDGQFDCIMTSDESQTLDIKCLPWQVKTHAIGRDAWDEGYADKSIMPSIVSATWVG